MAEWLDKLKSIIMGEPDEYEENYDEYDDEDYEAEEPRQSKSSSYSTFRNNTYKTSSGSKRTSGSQSSRYNSYGSSSSSQKILSINTNVNMQVVVATPKNLEEAGAACEDLKDRKTIVANLEGLDKDTAQRITDFFCGACYALDGTIQPISNRIFILGPFDVKLTGQFKEELEASGIKFPNTAMWR